MSERKSGAPGRFVARWETWMGLLNEALAFLGLTADSCSSAGRHELTAPRTRAEQRGLAQAMRWLPRHYATRLSARTLEEITTAAATGQWETAIDQLITTLHARAETITDSEREELRAVMEVLNMSTDCLDTLVVSKWNYALMPTPQAMSTLVTGASASGLHCNGVTTPGSTNPSPSKKRAISGTLRSRYGAAPVWLYSCWALLKIGLVSVASRSTKKLPAGSPSRSVPTIV
jgi:hypothetical protein